MIKEPEHNYDHDYNEKYIQPIMKKIKERSFSDYLDISIVIMIVALFVAIVFAFLVDFIFDSEIDWKDIGVNTVIISACTIAIYLLLRTYAMRKGRKTKAWTEAFVRLNERGKNIIEGDYAQYITAYCRDWEEQRLYEAMEDIILPVGISLDEYKTKYAKYTKKEIKEKFPDLSEYQYKTILCAKKVKRPKFNERYFYVNSTVNKNRSPSDGITTKQLNRLTTGRIVLTTVITSLVSAALLRDIIIDFSLASIINCLVKVAIIIFFGVIGMVGGFSFTAVRESSEMNAKSDEIEVFLKWCTTNKKLNKDMSEGAE